MELIAEKYKKTDLGLIPSDWQVKELGMICFPSKTRINPITSNTEFRCIELEHLSQGSGILLGYANSKDLLSQKSIFEKGDVLFGKLRPYLKKYYFADFNGVCTTEIWVLKAEKGISNIFLYHLIQSDRVIEAANQSTGTKMPRAEWKTVSETLIPLPSTKDEQTAIATALTDTDKYITHLENLIAKKRLIKQGAMQELLRPKEGWVVKKLGEICLKIQDGNYGESYPKSNEFVRVGIPFLTSKTIGNDGVLKENLIDFITKEKHSQLIKAHLALNDILFTNRGASVGTIGFVDKRISMGNIGPQLTLIRTNPQFVSPLFLYQLLKSDYFQNQILGTDSGSAMNFFGIGTTMKFQITIPPSLEIQSRMSLILGDMDIEINNLEHQLSKAQRIKQGMMQQLLTGKIRLV